MHGGLAAHPGGVHHPGIVANIFRDPEAQPLDIFHGARHVRGYLIKVIEAHQRARRVKIVAPGQALDVLHVVEELVGEAEGIFDAHRVADALHKAVNPALRAAAQRLKVGFGAIDILRGAHAEGKGGDGGHRAFAQDQVVVNKLFH